MENNSILTAVTLHDIKRCMIKQMINNFGSCSSNLYFQKQRRSKRFDPSDFDAAETEDVETTGCDEGSITNPDNTCSMCTAGTYAETTPSPQECRYCPLDSYSGDAATSCAACQGGSGTLDVGSDNLADCIG